MRALKDLPLFRKGRYTSRLIIEKRTVRVRPFGRLAAAWVTCCATAARSVWKGGFNEELRGVTGRRLERRLTGGCGCHRGWQRHRSRAGQRHPRPSTSTLQDVADAALAAQLRKHGAHHGTVVVMEVATGYIRPSAT